MFRCKPERNPRQAVLMIVILSVLTLSAFFVSVRIPSYRGIAQFTGIIMLVISIMLVNRYTITEMEYTVTPDCFSVTKNVGVKRTEVCSLDLSESVALVDKKTYKRSAEFRNVRYKYVLTQNIKANSMVYVCKFKGALASVEFEPNAAFVAVMRDAIDNATDNTSEKNQ